MAGEALYQALANIGSGYAQRKAEERAIARDDALREQARQDRDAWDKLQRARNLEELKARGAITLEQELARVSALDEASRVREAKSLGVDPSTPEPQRSEAIALARVKQAATVKQAEDAATIANTLALDPTRKAAEAKLGFEANKNLYEGIKAVEQEADGLFQEIAKRPVGRAFLEMRQALVAQKINEAFGAPGSPARLAKLDAMGLPPTASDADLLDYDAQNNTGLSVPLRQVIERELNTVSSRVQDPEVQLLAQKYADALSRRSQMLQTAVKSGISASQPLLGQDWFTRGAPAEVVAGMRSAAAADAGSATPFPGGYQVPVEKPGFAFGNSSLGPATWWTPSMFGSANEAPVTPQAQAIVTPSPVPSPTPATVPGASGYWSRVGMIQSGRPEQEAQLWANIKRLAGNFDRNALGGFFGSK